MGINGSVYKKNEGAQGKAYYSRLYRRLILLTLLCSLVPLLLVGWGINMHYTKFDELVKSRHSGENRSPDHL